MKYEYITYDGKEYCNVFIDRSKSHGIIHFTHEISVTLIKTNGEWKFDSAWHIGVSECEWNADELDDFKDTFPGLYEEILKGVN